MTESVHRPDIALPPSLVGKVAVTSLDRIYNWGRKNSIWPMMFGLACCAIEMICTQASRFDLARFGMEVMRPSPRQTDLLIVSGTVTKKMIPTLIRLYDQMAEPKYVVAMGACATSGGPFREGYNVIPGIGSYLPVDVFIPGCPPTPQALIQGLVLLQKKMEGQSVLTAPWTKPGDREIPLPELGSNFTGQPKEHPRDPSSRESE
jgi:NADH-quinone oxidoreductase subunit B